MGWLHPRLRILMSRSLHGFPWRLAVTFIASSYILADLFAFKGPLHELLMQGHAQERAAAAEVCGLPVTRQQLEEALREQLWKRNEFWAGLGPEARKQIRWLTLENLVNDRLIHAFRSRNGLHMDEPNAAAKLEMERMQRQFADPAEFPARLAAQQLTPQSLQARIHDAQLNEAWISEHIQPFLKEITQQDVRVWYDEFKETLRLPQAWHAAHIFLTRHDKAKPDRLAEIREIQRQLLTREKTFAQLAVEYSDDSRSRAMGGDLGWFTQARMPADFIAAVRQLKIGRFSEPVQTQLGWHLIIVQEHHASRLPALAEVAGEIVARLTHERREAAVKRLLTELRHGSQQPVLYHAEVIDQAEPAP